MKLSALLSMDVDGRYDIIRGYRVIYFSLFASGFFYMPKWPRK
jgi:hypothetical protein